MSAHAIRRRRNDPEPAQRSELAERALGQMRELIRAEVHLVIKDLELLVADLRDLSDQALGNPPGAQPKILRLGAAREPVLDFPREFTDDDAFDASQW